jgi:Flp pilus assembly protein TadD
MIAPHPVQEHAALEEDGALPELKQGNEYLKKGDPGTAVEFFARAVAKADADPSLKPDAKGRAHYSYGLGKAMVGDYDVALSELHMAQTLKQDKAWTDLEMRVRAWKKDAERVSEQMKDAAAAAPPQ